MVISEIERMLRDDTREKKRTGSGIHSRTGKRGYVGKMYFPYELLSTQDKRNYRKAGKVVRYNMYQSIVNWVEFKQLPENTQKNLMEEWREKNSASYIINELGISEQTYYKKLKDLGVELGDKRTMYDKLTYSQIEKDEMKQNAADYETIMSLKKDDFIEVWGELRDKFKNKELLKKIGESDMNKVYYLNNKLNKYIATDEDKQKKKQSEERNYLFDPIKVTEDDPEEKPAPENPDPKLATAPTKIFTERAERDDDNSTNFNQKVTVDKPKAPEKSPSLGFTTKMDGTYDSAYLSAKLRKLATLIEDEENDFQIALSIEEVQGKKENNETKQEKEMEAKKEIITSILKELF